MLNTPITLRGTAYLVMQGSDGGVPASAQRQKFAAARKPGNGMRIYAADADLNLIFQQHTIDLNWRVSARPADLDTPLMAIVNGDLEFLENPVPQFL